MGEVGKAGKAVKAVKAGNMWVPSKVEPRDVDDDEGHPIAGDDGRRVSKAVSLERFGRQLAVE